MLHIVEATFNDVPTIQLLADEIWHLHYPAIISVEQINFMLEAHYSTSAIEKSMRDGAKWFIVVSDKNTVGFFSVSKLNQRLWKLEKLYVHPTLHNRGIGRKIIEFISAFLTDALAERLTLNVNRNNRNSIEAYQKFGFKIVRAEDNYLGKFLLDDYVMELELNH